MNVNIKCINFILTSSLQKEKNNFWLRSATDFCLNKLRLRRARLGKSQRTKLETCLSTLVSAECGLIKKLLGVITKWYLSDTPVEGTARLSLSSKVWITCNYRRTAPLLQKLPLRYYFLPFWRDICWVIAVLYSITFQIWLIFVSCNTCEVKIIVPVYFTY
jgi:hypothetical protein